MLEYPRIIDDTKHNVRCQSYFNKIYKKPCCSLNGKVSFYMDIALLYVSLSVGDAWRNWKLK